MIILNKDKEVKRKEQKLVGQISSYGQDGATGTGYTFHLKQLKIKRQNLKNNRF